MNRLALAVLAVVCLSASAALRQADEHTWRDDFESDALQGWALPGYYTAGKDGANGVLRVGGPSKAEQEAVKLSYPGVGPAWADCAVQARIRQLAGSWAGLFARKSKAGHLEAFLFGARILVRRQPGSIVLSQAPLPASKDPWRTLRIVAVGPSLRVYVDGLLMFACADEELTAGTCGIAAHYTHAFWDDFELTDKLLPRETLTVRPVAPETGLLATPGQPATVRLAVRNAAREARTVDIACAEYTGAAATAGVKQTVKLGPGEEAELPVALGSPAAGLHWYDCAITEGGAPLETVRFPLAAVTPPDAPADEPFLVFGVYDKYELGGEPWELNTYLHATCADLRAHGFNTIMAGNSMPKPNVTHMDILARYGVKVILRGIGELPPEVAHHPAVLGIAFGDEPTVDDLDGYRKRFDELAAKYGKPVTTCLIGDSIGTGAGADPWLIWPKLGSGLKLARYYPIRKSCYDLLRYPSYKGYPPEAIFRMLETAAGAEGWYYVAQTFGDRVSEQVPEPYWRNPDAAEVKAMAHLGLAYGARGIICYTYQTERATWPALVEQRWLRAEDEKYTALAGVSAKVQPVRGLLLGSKWHGLEVRCDPPSVEAVARQTADGQVLIYLINRDTDAAVAATVTVLPVAGNKRVPLAAAKDLFSGREIALEHQADRSTGRVNLAPGDAELWAVTLPK